MYNVLNILMLIELIVLLIFVVIFVLTLKKRGKNKAKTGIIIVILSVSIAVTFAACLMCEKYDAAVYSFSIGELSEAKQKFEEVKYLPQAKKISAFIEAFDNNDINAIKKALTDISGINNVRVKNGVNELIVETVKTTDNGDLAFFLTSNNWTNIETYLAGTRRSLSELRNSNNFTMGAAQKGKIAILSLLSEPSKEIGLVNEMGLQDVLPEKYKATDTASVEYIILFEYEYNYIGIYSGSNTKAYQLEMTATLKKVNSEQIISSETWIGDKPSESISSDRTPDYIVSKPTINDYEGIVSKLLKSIEVA